MFRKGCFVLLICLLWGLPLQAQGSALAAFRNAAGQLVVASADGSVRWIVTNPGETLHSTLGYSWSPDGNQLFYAVDQGSTVSLRIGDVRSQTTQEYLQVSNGFVTGGVWLGGQPLVSDGSAVYQGATPISNDQALYTPFTNLLPNLPQNSGRDLIAWRDGQFFLNGQTALAGSTDYNQRVYLNGDWLAYGGYDPQTGSGTLYVVHLPTQNTLTLSSGRAIPTYPEQWLSNSELLYRDASGNVRVADVRCLAGGCSDNPLENGVVVLGVGAQQIQRSGNNLVYQEDTVLKAVSLDCVANDSCLSSAQTLAQNLNPDGLLQVRDSVIVYSAYTKNAFDPRDYTVYALAANCLDCGGVPLANGAMNGVLTPNGDYAVVEVVGDGIYSVRVQDGSAVYLTDAGISLTQIRWQE